MSSMQHDHRAPLTELDVGFGTTEKLLTAVNLRSIPRVKAALQDGDVDINGMIFMPVFGRTMSALRIAVHHGLVNMVELLLEHGAVVDNDCEMWGDVFRNKSSTAIFQTLFAAVKRWLHAAHPRLEGEALTYQAWDYLHEEADEIGTPIVDLLAVHGHPSMLAAALEHGLCVAYHHDGGATVIDYMMDNWMKKWLPFRKYQDFNVEKVRLLIAAGLPLDRVSDGSIPTLHKAIRVDTSDYGELVRTLLESRGCGDVNRQGALVKNPVGGYFETTALAHLITRPISVDGSWDVNSGAILRHLVDAHVDPTLMSNGRSPLLIAVEMCRFAPASLFDIRSKMVEELLAVMSRTQVYMAGTIESESLIMVILRRRVDRVDAFPVIQNLLAAGVDPNAIDRVGENGSGKTPLFYVIERSFNERERSPRGFESEMRMLIEYGADIHKPNDDGDNVAALINRRIIDWRMSRDAYEHLSRLFDGDSITRRLAVSMALHGRIGSVSGLQQMPAELMQKITGRDHTPLYLRPAEEIWGDGHWV
jgi:ankyrin repeat protein